MSGKGSKRRKRALQKKPADAPPNRIQQRLQVVSREIKFQGPLPHPELFDQYEHAHPGAGQWILDQATVQGDHRRGLESWVVRGGIVAEFFGIGAALLVSLAAIGAGTWLIMNDKEGWGLAAIIADLVALVWVYRTGQKTIAK